MKTPTLIIFGDKDRAINPATADILHKLMPRSEFIIMKGLGHLPMIEQPHKAAVDYLKFQHKTFGVSTMKSTFARLTSPYTLYSKFRPSA